MQAGLTRARGALLATGLLISVSGSCADSVDWLHRAASAAQRLNYAGTVYYQHGSRIETSRLTHFVDATGEYEKLVNLEGPLREVIRNNDKVTCYLPDAKLIRIENRAGRSVFPALLPNQIATLAQNYLVRRSEPSRVAGIEADVYILEPRDGLRFGHVFWTDPATGLLLKAKMFDEFHRVIEMSAFMDVQINARLDRSMVEPTIPAQPADWQVERAPSPESSLRTTGWMVSKLPAGFGKVVEGYRVFPGRPDPVAHLVYTDGLVAVSVFIEPLSGTQPVLGLSQQGAINVYKRLLDEHLVTALGETPGVTVRLIANAVIRK